MRWNAKELESSDWFAELVEQVQTELDAVGDAQADLRAALEAELAGTIKSIAGWSKTLADPDLHQGLREVIEGQMAKAIDARKDLEARLRELEAKRVSRRRLADPVGVAERLNRLGELLCSGNPTRTNLELALHIESIRCFDDGRAEVKTCKLGAMSGAANLVADLGPARNGAEEEATDGVRIRPRRLGRRRPDPGDASADARALVEEALDPERFARLGPEWFWTDVLRPPEKLCWSSENASAVARSRAEGKTHAELAEQFGVTVPTIRKALRFAAERDPSSATLPRKMPRARWPEQHFREVAKARAEGKTLKELCEHFGKSEPLIREALKLAPSAEYSPEDTGESQSSGE